MLTQMNIKKELIFFKCNIILRFISLQLFAYSIIVFSIETRTQCMGLNFKSFLRQITRLPNLRRFGKRQAIHVRRTSQHKFLLSHPQTLVWE